MNIDEILSDMIERIAKKTKAHNCLNQDIEVAPSRSVVSPRNHAGVSEVKYYSRFRCKVCDKHFGPKSAHPSVETAEEQALKLLTAILREPEEPISIPPCRK